MSAKKERWVIKIGSSLLTNNGAGLDVSLMQCWVDEMQKIRAAGGDLILVSSGAVAEGVARLGWAKRPDTLPELQAAAAVGQMGLIHAWEARFDVHKVLTAQILLTHDDLSHRRRYLNARSTLTTLLDLGVVPIINENDTVVTNEIRFGDNDTLAALVANLVEADHLIILTDQEGVFDADPRSNPDAQLITSAQAFDPRLLEVAGDSVSGLGRGGMTTKVRAARLAARSGATTYICSGREPSILDDLAQGKAVGTKLLPATNRLTARKQWLAGHLQLQGTLTLDEGAVEKLKECGSSLLPIGVIAVSGDFDRGEVVSCVDEAGNRVAYGLVNYDVDEARKILRHKSADIQKLLGYIHEPELIHRDNMVVF